MKAFAGLLALILAIPLYATVLAPEPPDAQQDNPRIDSIQLGPRPLFLVNDMDNSELKNKLQSCSAGPFSKTNFSIGHRGAPLQFPEHTKESYEAAALMGAGIIECDVTFTKDRELVCRHSQCDLHSSTNILSTDLAASCSVPPQIENGVMLNANNIKCCTSDITLAKFKSLQGKMDAVNKQATTLETYINATADWRTELYAGKGTLLSHRESIELFQTLGVKMMPELKRPEVGMPFEGTYSQTDYARQFIDDYRQAGVNPRDVWVQSFSKADLLYWINNEPQFAQQAVYLDAEFRQKNNRDLSFFSGLKDAGINIIAPPMFMLLSLAEDGNIIPSDYARLAVQAGLDIIPWTFERTNTSDGTANDWYYTDIQSAVNKDGDKYEVLHVLAQDVGIIGMFSDWPATTTYYANCMGLP